MSAFVIAGAGLVAMGYSAAFLQLMLHEERMPVLLTAARNDEGAQRSTASGAVVPAPALHVEQLAPVAVTHETAPETPPAAAAPAIPAQVNGGSRRSRSPSARLSSARRHSRTRSEPNVNADDGVHEHSERDVASAAPPAIPEPQAAPRPETQSELAAALERSPQAVDAQPVLSVKPLAAAGAPEDAALVAQPTRAQVRDTLLAMHDELAACAGDKHGTSYAKVTIQGSGRVSYSLIEGALAGSKEGSCMARALRQAHFPRFSGPAFNVRYPLAF